MEKIIGLILVVILFIIFCFLTIINNRVKGIEGFDLKGYKKDCVNCNETKCNLHPSYEKEEFK